jgi:predicted nucleotidyltransferase
VDILVEIESDIGLRFVELAKRLEDALGIRAEVVSPRAIKPRYWKIIQRNWSMFPRSARFRLFSHQ